MGIMSLKIKNKSCSAHRILSHKLSVGYHFNQVDDDNHRIQNISQKHILVQSYPLAAKAPGEKKSNKKALTAAKMLLYLGEKNPLVIFLTIPLAIDERAHRNK